MIDKAIEELAANTREAQTVFGGLSATQLNWKPSADQWSVGQALEHLIAINTTYFAPFDAIAGGTHRPTFAGRLPFWPKLMGKFILQGSMPEEPRKVKTSPAFEPKSSAVPAGIVGDFLQHHDELALHIGRLRGFNPNAVNVTSPFSSAVAYPLSFALQIIWWHERRHFAQARRVMAAAGFPAA